MAGFPLTGLDPNNPIPGIAREIKYAQGEGLGGGDSRDVLLIGNKRSSGSATVDEIYPTPIGSSAEAVAVAGAGSELHLMYDAFVKIPQQANIYFGVVAESGSGTAGTLDFTFTFSDAGPLSASTQVKVRVLGEEYLIGVVKGDSVATIATTVFTELVKKTHLPITITNPSSGVVRVTNKNLGPRHDYTIDQMTMTMTISSNLVATKGSKTAGTNNDNQDNLRAQIENKLFYYQVNGRDCNGASASDGGCGEHSEMITAQASASIGKDQIMICASNSTNSNAYTAAILFNNALVHPFWAGENNPWPAYMIAAHVAGVKRAEEIAHPGANLTNYGLKSGQIFSIPKPYSGADIPTTSEIILALNNGLTPISFDQTGRPYIVRQITSYSQTNSVSDYRVREGHIPSCMHYFWQQVKNLVLAQSQPFSADDPLDGEKPLQGVTYPRDVRAIIIRVINELTGTFLSGGPVLDPSYRQAMIDSIEAVRIADGISARVKPVAVRHNNKSQFRLEESSVGG